MSNNLSKIASFEIIGLFGDMDVKIPFDSPTKILVSENGFGKTTVLNSLYFALTGRIDKLAEIPFQSILLKFGNKTIVQLEHEQINRHLSYQKTPDPTDFLYRRYGTDNATAFIEAVKNDHLEDVHQRMLQELRKRFGSPRMHSLLQRIKANELEDTRHKLQANLELIKVNFPMEFLYLPTYRRIEEDLSNLSMFRGDLEEAEETFDLEDGVIQFGMQDVVGRIDELVHEIRGSSVIGFQMVNGQMLNQLVSESQLDQKIKDQLEDIAVIELVIERIGGSIDAVTKSKIFELLSSGDLFDGHHNTLAIFLSKLREVYEEQKANDNALKAFTEICNKYLVNKDIIYDESSVQVNILSIYDGTPVEFQHLSSGEKQIISLFSKLFLSGEKEYAVFFDEPELSLSIEWQKDILPDIINSGKCGFLLAATHSPFIFENDLKHCTTSLKEYITR